MATVMPRSLNEPVGLWPSCLIERHAASSKPAHDEPARLSRSGVFPSGWDTMVCAGAEGEGAVVLDREAGGVVEARPRRDGATLEERCVSLRMRHDGVRRGRG